MVTARAFATGLLPLACCSYQKNEPRRHRVLNSVDADKAGLVSPVECPSPSVSPTPAAMEPTMRAPKTVRSAEPSAGSGCRSFFMRDFLYSEIANVHRISNLPDDPDLAIAAGRRLCEELLEPLQATFGRIAI